jgi:GT2 family glycosyltransferase
MSNVFAIIVNYNGGPWLANCLESLRCSEHPVRIIVVDNASRDDSVLIARSVDAVHLIQNRSNLGFGRANNVGIDYALRRGADFVFLLNQDAEVEPTTISELLSFMRERDDVGVASPVHLNDSGALLDRNFLRYYLAPQAPEFISDAYHGKLADSYRVFGVNAAAWLVSRRCLQEVGGFDPIFFMYGEDDDYCARVHYHGFSCYVVSGARIRHARGFHQPAYRRRGWKGLIRNTRFTRSQAVRSLKDPGDRSLLASAYRVLTTLVLESLSRSLASLTPSPFVPSALAAAFVCGELFRIARHKRACQLRGPTWLEFRVDPVPPEAGSSGLEDFVTTSDAAPVVTVGMPVYNGAAFLQAALDSLLSQTYTNYEIIISDNNSDDGTEKICRQYASVDPRIRYVRHDVNRGAAWNHNFVVAEARGRFFRWQHADDFCEPRHLERCVVALETDHRVVLAYPQTVLIDAAGTVTGHYDDRLGLSDETPHGRLRRLLANVFLCNPVLGLIRMDALRRTALLGYFIRADHVLLAELAMAGRWIEVPEALFRRRIHEGKSTVANRSPRDRAIWLDPRGGRKVFFSPRLRLFVEHLRAAGRACIELREKIHCMWLLSVWHGGIEVRRFRARASSIGSRLASWAGSEHESGQRSPTPGAVSERAAVERER